MSKTVCKDYPWRHLTRKAKREVLDAVFTGVVVEGKRIVDVRAPYSWLMRWSAGDVDTISAVTTQVWLRSLMAGGCARKS